MLPRGHSRKRDPAQERDASLKHPVSAKSPQIKKMRQEILSRFVHGGAGVFFFHSCSDGVNTKRQSPAPVCDRAAAGSDPVQTGLPPSEVALRIHFTCCVFLSIELLVQRPAREPPNLLDLNRGKQLSKLRGDCTASCSHHFFTIHEFLI